MTKRQLFKCAFIARCIDQGITAPGEIAQRAESLCKQAAEGGGNSGILPYFLGDALARTLSGIGGAAKDTAEGAWNILGPAAIAAPPVIGGAAGYVLSKARDTTDFDAEEAKKRELIDEYKRQSGRLRRRSMLAGV